jgi:hypothetical protein
MIVIPIVIGSDINLDGFDGIGPSIEKLLWLLGLSIALGAAFARFRLVTLIHFVTAIARAFVRAFVRLTARFLPGVVGYIPTATLKVKTVQRHKLLQTPITVRAISQGRVRELLQRFSCLVAFYALILVNRHF